MNEVTRIHLGRTAFTISVDAHKELQAYLHAIKAHVGGKHEDVLKEVELRMAELMTEKGVAGENNVITKEEVTYLKEQLGSPSDFEDDEPSSEASKDETQPRRLFRDPRNQILGGVASGLGTYFGIDPWIPRLLFLLLTFAGASGILIYLVLWALLPKAKTKSDFLQMEGKPVTIDALKDFVQSEELQLRAERAGRKAGAALEFVLRRMVQLLASIVGGALTTLGVLGVVWTILVGTYVLVNSEKLFDAGRIFPIGTQEVGLVILAMAVLVCLFGLLLGMGISLARRKWLLPVWAVVPLITAVLIGSAVGVSLAASAAPRIRDRYEAAHHTQTRHLNTFQSLEVSGGETVVTYEPSDTYSVEIHSVGQIDTQKIRTTITNGALHIDTHDFHDRNGCDWLCVHTEDVSLVVHAPQLERATLRNNAVFKTNTVLRQKDLTMATDQSAELRLTYIDAAEMTLTTDDHDGLTVLEMKGLRPTAGSRDAVRNTDRGAYSIGHTDTFTLPSSRSCDLSEPFVYMNFMPNQLTIGGQTFTSPDMLNAQQTNDKRLAVNCVVLR
jgi:phage shock protein PspC (stress-responsive transcriptional regulator)